MLLMGYNTIAVMTLLALLQADGKWFGATPFEWVGAVGIAGSLVVFGIYWWVKVKEPRDYKDAKDDVQRAITEGQAKLDLALSSAATERALYQTFMEKQEERHKSEVILRTEQYTKDMDRAHATFTATIDSTMSRVDVYNKGFSDFKAEVRGDLRQILDRLPRDH